MHACTCVLITYIIHNTCLYRCVPINYFCIPITCSQYVLCLRRRKIPHAFQLPKFPLDVEIALQQGKLLAITYQKFISGTARAVLSYKRHPTPDERNREASEIVRKYPFLKTPGNKPEVHVECCQKAMFSVRPLDTNTHLDYCIGIQVMPHLVVHVVNAWTVYFR